MGEFRIDSHPVFGMAPEKRVAFYFNGQRLEGIDGEPLGVSLMAHGIRIMRYDRITGEPRGIFCGIGHCYECRVTVGTTRDVRSCLTPTREGIRVFTQDGWGQRINDSSSHPGQDSEPDEPGIP